MEEEERGAKGADHRVTRKLGAEKEWRGTAWPVRGPRIGVGHVMPGVMSHGEKNNDNEHANTQLEKILGNPRGVDSSAIKRIF